MANREKKRKKKKKKRKSVCVCVCTKYHVHFSQRSNLTWCWKTARGCKPRCLKPPLLPVESCGGMEHASIIWRAEEGPTILLIPLVRSALLLLSFFSFPSFSFLYISWVFSSPFYVGLLSSNRGMD